MYLLVMLESEEDITMITENALDVAALPPKKILWLNNLGNTACSNAL